MAFAIAYPLVRQSSAAYRQVTDESLVRSVLVPPLRAQGLGIQNLTVVKQRGQLVVSVDVAGPEPVSASSDLSVELANEMHRQITLIFRWTKRTETTSVAGPRTG